jgi:hypothetical protein
VFGRLAAEGCGSSADALVFPAQCMSWSEAAGPRCTDHILQEATHFLLGQDASIEELADLLVAWADAL